MSAARAKGTWGETKFRGYIAAVFPDVDRNPLRGVRDEGDLNGIPDTAGEVKNRKGYAPQAWLRQVARARLIKGCRWGVVFYKPVGVGETRIGEWHVLMTLDTYLDMMCALHHGPACGGHFGDTPEPSVA